MYLPRAGEPNHATSALPGRRSVHKARWAGSLHVRQTSDNESSGAELRVDHVRPRLLSRPRSTLNNDPTLPTEEPPSPT